MVKTLRSLGLSPHASTLTPIESHRDERMSRERLVASIAAAVAAAKRSSLDPCSAREHSRSHRCSRASLIDSAAACGAQQHPVFVGACLYPHTDAAPRPSLRCGPSDEYVRFDSCKALASRRPPLPRFSPTSAPPISTQHRPSVCGDGRRKQPNAEYGGVVSTTTRLRNKLRCTLLLRHLVFRSLCGALCICSGIRITLSSGFSAYGRGHPGYKRACSIG